MSAQHFTLDVDPAPVRSVARRLGRIITELERQAPQVLSTPDEIGSAWTGGPARKVKGEMKTLGERLTDAEPLLRDAVRALKDLANAYEDALDALPALNRRWDEAVTAHSEAVDRITRDQAKAHKKAAESDEPVDVETTNRINRQASSGLANAASSLRTTQGNLETDFEAIRDELRRDTRRAAAALSNAMAVKAPWLKRMAVMADVDNKLSRVKWRELTRKALADDLPLTVGYYEATAEAEVWDDALETHGLEVPAHYDLDRGRELVAALDAELAALEGQDAATRSKLINQWASQLDPADLSLLAVLDSARVGNLDGIPNRVRYAANRVNLSDGIEAERAQLEKYWTPPPATDHPRWAEYSRLVDRIDQLEALLAPPEMFDPVTNKKLTGPYQTLAFVPPTYDGDKVVDDGRLAVVMGNLDKAEFVGTVVPGITNRIDNFDGTLSKAVNLQTSVPGSATIAWLGYDTPEFSDSVTTDKAEVGGLALRDFMAGMVRREGSESVVLAHSYGTLVTSKALQAGMRPDRVVLFGSPGLGENIKSKSDLGIPDDIPVYAMRAPGDPVSVTAAHGMDPVDMPGIIRLDTDWGGKKGVTGHSDYTKAGTQSLQNLAWVLEGLTPTPDKNGRHLVTGGNPLTEDGLAGKYNQNVRDLIDILQKEVSSEDLSTFASVLEQDLQNMMEGGKQPSIPELTDLARRALDESDLGEHLTAQELGAALREAGFVDDAAKDVREKVEKQFDSWDGLDDVRIPIFAGPGRTPIVVDVPDGINEWFGDRAGDLTEGAVRGTGNWATEHLPGLESVLDTADWVHDRYRDVVNVKTAVETIPVAVEAFAEAAQKQAVETYEISRDAVVREVVEIAVEADRARRAVTRTVGDTADAMVDAGRGLVDGLSKVDVTPWN